MALTRPKYSNIVDTDYKASCRIVTTTNITLSGGAPLTYDGVTLSAQDRVLVAGQNTGSQNGIYIVITVGSGSNGTWARALDADSNSKITAGLQCAISEGTYGGHTWRLTTPDPITLGSTALTFLDAQSTAGGTNSQLQFNNSGTLQGASALSYVSANTSLISTGNIFATTIYTSQLLWSANSSAVTLTGNINPTIYIGNTAVTTANTLVDSVLLSGNNYVTWTLFNKDVTNSRYRALKFEGYTDGTSFYSTELAIGNGSPYKVATFVANVDSGYIKLWARGDSNNVTSNFERRTLGSATPLGYINNFGPQGIAGSIAETGGNIKTTATTTSTSTTTGALQVAGGAGIAGNLYVGGDTVIGGNLTVLGTNEIINSTVVAVADLNMTLANGAGSAAAADGGGITVAGANATWNYTATTDAWTANKNVSAPALYSTGLYWSGNNAALHTGINYITSATPPAGVNYGDQWYDTSSDILFEWQTSDGATGFWVDISSPVTYANNAGILAANVVSANLITSGNITVGVSQSNYYNSGGAGKGIDIVSTTSNKVGYLNLVGGTSSSGLLTFGNINSAQAVITTGTDNSITIATKNPSNGANISSSALTIYSDQTARFFSNLTVSGNATVTSNLSVTQSALFRGPYDENSILSGVFVGNTGTAPGITPRVGFFNGNTQQNWQIDNNLGEFRWFVPGSTKLSLYPNGNLNVVGSLTVGGKKAVNGPAFSAYANATLQTITTGSQQKVLFQVEEFDTDNCYTNSRFTPTVEGYYQLNAEVRLDGATGTGEMMIVIWKNGTEYKRGTNQSGTQIASNFWAMQVSSLVYANGTGDYFEIYVQQGSGSSVTVTAVNSSNITWFNGAMVRGA